MAIKIAPGQRQRNKLRLYLFIIAVIEGIAGFDLDLAEPAVDPGVVEYFAFEADIDPLQTGNFSRSDSELELPRPLFAFLELLFQLAMLITHGFQRGLNAVADIK